MTEFNIVFMNENEGKDVKVLNAKYIPRVNEIVAIQNGVHLVSSVIYDIAEGEVNVYIGGKEESNEITGGNGNKATIPMNPRNRNSF